MISKADTQETADPRVGSALGEVRAVLDGLLTSHQQTVQQERLRAFREMAGGEARDFNNTLSGILGRAPLLQAGGTDPAERRPLVTTKQVCAVGACVSRRFQDFS